MQKTYRFLTLFLAMSCCGKIMSSEMGPSGATTCPLFLKPAFELTEKDQVLLDILQQDVLSSKGDFKSLTETQGTYPKAFEEAFVYYLEKMKQGCPTRVKYQKAIQEAAERLAELLFPVHVEEAVMTEGGSSRNRDVASLRGECASLLIGINYERTSSALSNCIRDIDHVLGILLQPHVGVKLENVIYMSDRKKGTEFYPTKKNILTQFANFANLVNQTKVGYFHYSGHGSSVIDKSGDEADGYDEALVPIDYDKSGFLLDDDVYRSFVKLIDPDVTLLVTTDCCHSGTILDLPYRWRADGSYTIEHNLSQEELDRLPNIVMLSGCRDAQTSADGGPITVNREESGALTGAFLKVLKAHDYEITYRQLLVEVNQVLKTNGFDQRPELTSARLIDLDDYYLMHATATAQ